MFNKDVSRGRLALSIALTGQLLLFLAMPGFTANFPDTGAHWAQQSIERLSNQNVLGGYPDGMFRPRNPVTRAEFSAMLFRALELQSSTGAAGFRDVPSSHWAYVPIETVKANGFVSGYPGNVFMPNRNISRAEAIAVLANAARLPMPDAATTNAIMAQYADSGQVPAWARPAVAAAIQNGIFVNDPQAAGRIDSLQMATRGEVAVMLDNLRQFSNVAQRPATVGQQQAGQQTVQTQQNVNLLQGYVMTVPAHTRFVATLTTPIHSELNNVGDQVRLTMNQPLISSSGQVAIPAGSEVLGTIQNLEESGRLGRDARMVIDFNEVVLPDGQRITIFGRVATEDGELRASTAGRRALKAVGTTAVGAGLGAALGTAIGPLSGGRVGRGAIYGTAVGAGVGALAAAASEGKELVLPAGTQVEIQLHRPVVVQPSQ